MNWCRISSIDSIKSLLKCNQHGYPSYASPSQVLKPSPTSQTMIFMLGPRTQKCSPKCQCKVRYPGEVESNLKIMECVSVAISQMSQEKTLTTFHYTGCLIGILIMVHYNAYITGEYNALYTPTNQGFFIAQIRFGVDHGYQYDNYDYLEIREKRPWLRYVTLSLSTSCIFQLAGLDKKHKKTVLLATNNCHVHFTKNTYVIDSRQMKYLLYIYICIYGHPRKIYTYVSMDTSKASITFYRGSEVGKHRVSVENAPATPDVLSAARNQACEDFWRKTQALTSH